MGNYVTPRLDRMHTLPETYIGDGVYASFDGYQIWLRTKRENGMHKIALEPDVFDGLLRYAARAWPTSAA